MDKMSVGKKACLSLRELEKQIGYDLDSQMAHRQEHHGRGAGTKILGDQNSGQTEYACKLQVCAEPFEK